MKIPFTIAITYLYLSIPQAIADENIKPSLDLTWATKIQKQIDDLSDTLKKDLRVPTGTIVAFYGEKAPKGWMLCDGSTIASDFEDLRKAVGERVPDLRGMFLRGANAGRNDGKGDSELDRKLGSFQEDQIRKHSHTLSLPGAAGNNAFKNREPAWSYDDWHGSNKAALTTEQGAWKHVPKILQFNLL